MTSVHACPRCDLRFTTTTELESHLQLDHQVNFGPAPVDEVSTPAPRGGRLLVPVDPQREPTAAIDVAAALARQLDAEVELVAAVLPGVSPSEAAAYLRGRAERLRSSGLSAVRWTSLGEGDPAELVSAHIGEASDVVVCLPTRARARIAEAVLGTVAGAILSRVSQPTILVGPAVGEAPERFERVMVALDGSELAERALDVAAPLAERLGASVHLVEVLDEQPPTGDVLETAYLNRLAGDKGLSEASYDSLHGRHPARAIVDQLGEVPTLVAMGTHGRTGLRRVLLGSVAHDVVHSAPAPVLVVPSPG